MYRKNRPAYANRVAKAAALAAQGNVSPIDMLVGIGWVDAGTAQRWGRDQIDCLEGVIQTNRERP